MTWEQEGRTVAVGELTLVPVERVSLVAHRRGDALFFAGCKRPVAVLLRRGDREWRIAVPPSDRLADAAAEG